MMVNPARGEVRLELADEILVLVPSFARLAALEAHLDTGLIDLAQRFQTRHIGLRELAAICAFGCGEDDTAIDRRGAQLLQVGIANILTPLAEFLAAALAGAAPGKPVGPAS